MSIHDGYTAVVYAFDPLPKSLAIYGDEVLKDAAARINTELKARAEKKAAAEQEKKRQEEEAKRPKPGDIVQNRNSTGGQRFLVIDPESDTARALKVRYKDGFDNYLITVSLTSSVKGTCYVFGKGTMEKVAA